jgi:replicative DNA helicase
LSREAEYREGKRPQLKDLHESDAIEEYADKVIFIHKLNTNPFGRSHKVWASNSHSYSCVQALIKKASTKLLLNA